MSKEVALTDVDDFIPIHCPKCRVLIGEIVFGKMRCRCRQCKRKFVVETTAGQATAKIVVYIALEAVGEYTLPQAEPV